MSGSVSPRCFKKALLSFCITFLLLICKPGNASVSWFVSFQKHNRPNHKEIRVFSPREILQTNDNPEFPRDLAERKVSIAGGYIIQNARSWVPDEEYSKRHIEVLNGKVTSLKTVFLEKEERKYTPTWNFLITGISALKDAGLTGAGTRIGVIAGNYSPDHVSLNACIKNKKKIFKETPDRAVSDLHLVHPLGILAGFVSEKFAGVAPEADVYLATLSPESSTSEGLLLAIEWLVNQPSPPDVILFCVDFPGALPVSLSRAVSALRNIGIIPVIAAGNNPDKISGIAAHPSAITIGAIDRWKQRALFSGQGPAVFQGEKIMKPNFCAPGDAVLGPADKSKFKIGSGTLQAAAHFAGVFLLLKQARPEIDPELIISAMERSSKDLEDAGPDYQTGFGMVDPFAALRIIDTPPDNNH